MKKIFNLWFLSLALLTFSVAGTVGLVVANDLHKSTVTIQHQEADVSVVIEAPKAAEVVVASEVPQLCKDEAGQPRACSDQDLINHLIASVGGYKGMTALAVAFAIAKLLLLLLLSPFFTTMFPSLLRGDVKLLVATGLNLVVGVLGLMLPPVSLAFGAALLHSSTLALASVFANQAYKQILTSKGKS